MKTCSRCRAELPETSFHRVGVGRYHACKECRSQSRRTTPPEIKLTPDMIAIYRERLRNWEYWVDELLSGDGPVHLMTKATGGKGMFADE